MYLDKIDLWKQTRYNLNWIIFCNTFARQRFCIKSFIYFHDFQNMHTHFLEEIHDQSDGDLGKFFFRNEVESSNIAKITTSSFLQGSEYYSLLQM